MGALLTKGILIDNWTLQRALHCYLDNMEQRVYSAELIALVEALALWDNVYYWDNGRTFWRGTSDLLPNSILSNLHPLKQPDLFSETPSVISENFYGNSIVADGAVKYLHLADHYNLSYLPVDKRAKFILENDLYEVFGQVYSRADIFDDIDKEVESYYRCLSQEIRRANISFQPHCLFQYIDANRDNNSDIFEVARELGRDKAVRAFKKWVSSFEDKVARGTYIEVHRINEELRSIESELIARRSKIEFEMSLGLPFAFSISLSIPFSKPNPELVFPLTVFKKATRIE